jgi:hypothetical protein
MMTLDQRLPHAAPAPATEHSTRSSLWSRLAAWLRTCADWYAAWQAYEDLARLSNAELNRRGLSRATLAREVFKMLKRRS